MPRLLLISSVLLLLTGNARSSEPSSPRPVLSESGKKRLVENIKTVEENIHDLTENLAATRKNLKTIREELTDLEGLEKDHLELRKRYDAYLASAQTEIKKNEEAAASLDASEKALGLTSVPDPTSDAGKKLTALRAERQERLDWKNDALQKAAKAEKQLFDLLKNLRDVQSRRGPLNESLTNWSGKEKDYQRMLDEAQARRRELEDLASDASAPSAPAPATPRSAPVRSN